jgi:hypothetical protein
LISGSVEPSFGDLEIKKIAFVLAAFGALAHPSFAETAWEKIEHGIDVVKDCAGDVRQFCKEIKPGDGRVKACMAGHLADLSGACLKALADPPPAVLSDGASAKPKLINMRLMRYIEMFLATIDPSTGDLVAECYGSYANPDIPVDRDSAPQALVAALNMNEIKEKYGVLGASLNGPKLSIADSWVIDVGVVRQFGDMKFPHTAQLNLGKKIDVNNVTPYEPQRIARSGSVITWNKGSKVMVLDDPAGNAWIMKGFQLGLKPQHTYDEFMAAGQANFKKLPPGWNARIVTLEQDNIEKPEGFATIMSDEFFNVYDKTGPGMSNYKP